MKQLFTILSVVLFSSSVFSQVYKSPESVEYDYANHRWFIGNHGSGVGGHSIVTKNCATCALQSFASGFTTGSHGLEIVNDTIYACDGGNLRAYNINTAALVFNKVITGASFLNGITHDNMGNLFITDYTNNKIFRFNTATRAFNVFVSAPGTNPNGILFDQPANRCVYVLWGGAVKSVLLSDSTVSTVLASSGLTSLDGIAKDGASNWYISSWGLNGVTKFTSTFTSPVNVLTGQTSPADIFYTTTDTLAVPHSGTDNIVTFHYFGTSAGISESANDQFRFQVYPNPVAKAADLKYELLSDGNVKIELFDVKGELVQTVLNEQQSKGEHFQSFNRSGLSQGNYFFRITANDVMETKRIVIAE